MSDQITLSLILLIFGLIVVLPLVYWFSTRKPQAQTRGQLRRGPAAPRMEPVIGETGPDAADLDPDLRAQLDELGNLLADDSRSPEQGELLDGATAADRPAAASAAAAHGTNARKPGARPNRPLDRIVSLFVHAPPGRVLHGTDLVVAAEKVGLVYGDMGIYHRLVDGREDEGPIFSMANIAKPGSFDLRRLSELETPGLSFFMTLPGPLPALDAWNSMLPVAQRVAQLLDAELLDESRNPLVEQTVAYVRNEMRQYDRDQERQRIRANW
jgi:cell division protein ZipA